MRSRDIKRRHGMGRKRSNLLEKLPRFRLPSINISKLRYSVKTLSFPRGSMTKKTNPQPARRRYNHRTRFPIVNLSSLNIKELFFRACVLATIILVLVVAWRILRPGVSIRVSPDTVAAFRVPHRAIGFLREYSQTHGIPFAELFAIFNAENNFFPEKNATYDISSLETMYVTSFERIKRRYNARSLAPYVDMYRNLFAEIEVFPIPDGWYEFDASIMFGNSWGVEQNFQGTRMHMGAAIVDRENIRGRVPVVSMTSGVITNAGWDNQLGYFVGVTTHSGSYFLYAHLDNLASGLSTGQAVTAGQALGQMGNSGGGRGSRSFPVHLHLAISPDVSFVRGQFWINPYPILRYLENRTEV